jgi:S-adenosylmethionine:tRNA ribosyltransferase-isomerase
MLTSLLDYNLPPEFIAQTPIEPRDAAKLLVFNRSKGEMNHHVISDLPDLLQSGDLLVFNDTRVLKARLIGSKPTGGKVEALLLKELAKNRWETLLKPSARLKTGAVITFSRNGVELEARLLARLEETWEIEFLLPQTGDVRDYLDQLGEIPLPPYIHEKSDDERYQTTFSAKGEREEAVGSLDSAAAPTAGLHFTEELFERLRARNIDWTFVTLAVGVGTFRPVQADNLEDHKMHGEEFWISSEAAQKINAQKRANRRVIAVGTTSVRTLESMAIVNSKEVIPLEQREFVRSGAGQTHLFLRPGSPIHIVDALVTNFHLPKSTLLALVAAFVEAKRIEISNGENGSTDIGIPKGKALNVTGEHYGFQIIHALYNEAMSNSYRFFSFGDAMFIE